jgi:hypothetical protein
MRWLLVTFLVCVVVCVVGCQFDISAGASSKAFYANNQNGKVHRDPRKAMYKGSGYTEKFSSGGQTGFVPLEKSKR